MPKKRDYGGRKSRARSRAELLLMQQFSAQLADLLGLDRFKNKKNKFGIAAGELGISRAALYNYFNKLDVPGFEVLKLASERWKFHFKFIDFESALPNTQKKSKEVHRQMVLSFLEAVNKDDVEIVKAKQVQGDKLLLTVQIRFAG